MKKLRKVLALVLAMVMVLGMSTITAFAESTGTITVENATYGKEYKAYKVFDATFDSTNNNKVSYTVKADKKDYVDTNLFDISTAADKDGNYAVIPKTNTKNEDIIKWVKENYSEFDSTGITGVFDNDNYTVKFNNAPYGYYYITSTLGAVITIDTANPSPIIKDKNASAPTPPVKKIASVDGVDTDSYNENVHVGSVIGFKITGNATNWTTSGTGNSVTTSKNTAYTFEDTPTNLDINLNSFVVKVNGEGINKNAYSAIIGNDGKLTVNIPLMDTQTGSALYEAKDNNSAYIPIEITYNATITAAAADAPAKNEIGKEQDKLYTYMFTLSKVDENKDPLQGAQFELFKGNTKLAFIDNKDGSYTYSPSGTITTLDMTTYTNVIVKGLDNKQDYTLKEITVPDGYNQAEDMTVEKDKLVQADGNNVASSYTVEVVNKQGAELPATGGMGTTLFYVFGAVLVIGAGIVLVARRRMAK